MYQLVEFKELSKDKIKWLIIRHYKAINPDNFINKFIDLCKGNLIAPKDMYFTDKEQQYIDYIYSRIHYNSALDSMYYNLVNQMLSYTSDNFIQRLFEDAYLTACDPDTLDIDRYFHDNLYQIDSFKKTVKDYDCKDYEAYYDKSFANESILKSEVYEKIKKTHSQIDYSVALKQFTKSLIKIIRKIH